MILLIQGVLGYFNDLWIMEIFSGRWIHLSGDSNPNNKSIYGIKYESAPRNIPGSRFQHRMVLDDSQNALYIFGGYGYDATATGLSHLPVL